VGGGGGGPPTSDILEYIFFKPGSMPKTLKTFALHERLSRAGHGGQRKTSAWSWRAVEI
jgi:hypothetical protein